MECIGDKIVVKYKKFDNSVEAFHNDGKGNAGFDLFSRDEVTLQPGEAKKIRLNVATHYSEINVAGFIFQRSSTYKKWGVRLTNNVGLVDFSYNGSDDEWLAEFKNETNEPKTIKVGDKICQAVFLRVPEVMMVQVDDLDNENRGGFGTSGVNQVDL